jgi:hypothetical protein
MKNIFYHMIVSKTSPIKNKNFYTIALIFLSIIGFSAHAQVEGIMKNNTIEDINKYSEINANLNHPSVQIESTNYVSPLPSIAIVQNGTSSLCNPSTIQLCNATGGNIYALSAYPFNANSIAKYTTNFANHTLVKDNAFIGPLGLTVNYGIDRNPITGIVYFITGQGQGSQRKLCTINLATNAIVYKGPVIATTGSNQVQDFTFDNSGNMYVAFQGGIIQKIDYNSVELTPTAFASGLPTGGVGLTYDFDANRLIYAAGTFANKKLYQISSTGVSSLLFAYSSSISTTCQGIEYVGNNICYITSSDSSDLIYRLNLSTQETNMVLTPINFSAEIKDLMYVPLALQWSGPSGNIGTTTCVNVIPNVTTTYTLTATNEFGVSASATKVITLLACINPVINLKLFVEGYYETNLHAMKSVKNNQDGFSPLTDATDITVQLCDASNLNLVASIVTVLKTNGNAFCNFTSVPNGTYYLKVITSNTVPTWSSNPITITTTTPMTYDFSDDLNKVAGQNMVFLEEGVYGFFSGDFFIDGVQDGNIDNADYSKWEADINNISFGVFATDLNGDSNVDNADYSIWEANYNNGVYMIPPF